MDLRQQEQVGVGILVWLRLAKEALSDELRQQGLGWLCSGMAMISPSGREVLYNVPDSDPKKAMCSSQAGGS